jgi:hypothetical protein
MKILKYILFYTVQFTWGLLQNILGFCLFIKYRNCRHEFYHGAALTYHEENWGGISLGIFTFVNGKRNAEWVRSTKVHEFGHTVQSLILGPLYLFVIGIPSIIWCNGKKYIKMRKEQNVSYFDFYPEKWANTLGAKVTKEDFPTV